MRAAQTAPSYIIRSERLPLTSDLPTGRSAATLRYYIQAY
jgi:hypothetical protein